MTWPHRGVLRQLEQNLREAVIQRLRAARLKVGTAAASNEQGIACKDMPTFVGSQIKTHAAGGVARGVQGLQRKGAKRNNLTIDQLN